MRKPASRPLTVSIPKSLERDLRQAARRQGRPFESVIEACLRDGLEQLWWEGYADNLIDRVNKARSTPGLTGRQRRTIQEIGLAEFAGTVAAVTSKQPRAVTH
jgi:hypothetical protein